MAEKEDHSIDSVQGASQVVRYGIGKRLQFLVRGLQLRGSILHSLFQLLARSFKSGIPLLDLDQHLVECVDQNGDLVDAGERLGAYGVIPVARDATRRLGERNDGPRHQAANGPCHQ